jgi:hypothetical protein
MSVQTAVLGVMEGEFDERIGRATWRVYIPRPTWPPAFSVPLSSTNATNIAAVTCYHITR